MSGVETPLRAKSSKSPGFFLFVPDWLDDSWVGWLSAKLGSDPAAQWDGEETYEKNFVIIKHSNLQIFY